jgi:acetyltransferase-like isoleucine patch superfamily enzyme
MIGPHTVILTSSHYIQDLDRPMVRQGNTRIGVTVEDDVWIGANVTILDGAYISRGCVIAAGAVVRGKTEPMAIYAGVPARRIKSRLKILDTNQATRQIITAS